MNPFDLVRYLPLLAEDDGTNAAGNGEADDPPATDDADTSGGEQGGSAQASDEAEPAITFPDKKAFHSRIDREANARLKKQAEELGFESVDAMLSVVQEHQQRKEAEKTELQRAQDELAKYQAERDAAIESRNLSAVRTSALEVAGKLGIRSDRNTLALKLADIDQLAKSAVDAEGNVDEEAVTGALQKAIEELPELTATHSHAARNSTDHGSSTNTTSPDMNSVIRKLAGYS